MLKVYPEIVQGSDEWYKIRCGLLTASEMKNIITPAKLLYSQAEEKRGHLLELAAQRINSYVEPMYVSADMARGSDDESYARGYYDEHIAPVEQVGFITNDKWGFTLGFSPDGLVGDDGLIECKSRRQRIQLGFILEGKVPADANLQMQAGMLVSEREWCDYVSFCGGMPMKPVRVPADAVIQKAIVDAATRFHEELDEIIRRYGEQLADPANRLIPTERHIEQEIHV